MQIETNRIGAFCDLFQLYNALNLPRHLSEG